MGVIECKDLTKSYGNINAVNHINISLEENRIYGLLGRNGAGKTTLLNMIYGNIFKDQGEIKISGRVLINGETAEGVCLVQEEAKYFRNIRVEELLNLTAEFHTDWDDNFADKLVRTFKLDLKKRYKKLSRGMKSMVNIIIGLASREQIVLLDEPTLGLDALMREKFYSVLLEDYAENPRTILLSTHLIDEVARVLEYVYIIDDGRIVLEESSDVIKEKTYLLSGKREVLSDLFTDKNIIHTESYGSIEIAAIYDDFTREDREKAKRHDISVDGISLQKFFAYFVEGVE